MVTPKNTKKNTERIIPLPIYAVEALQSLEASGLNKPIPYHPSTLSHRWLMLRRGCEYKGKKYKGTNVQGTFHGLRRTTISHLKKLGLDPDLRDIMVGHKRDNVSSIHYTDYLLALDTVREALERLTVKFFPNYTPIYTFSKAVESNSTLPVVAESSKN